MDRGNTSGQPTTPDDRIHVVAFDTGNGKLMTKGVEMIGSSCAFVISVDEMDEVDEVDARLIATRGSPR